MTLHLVAGIALPEKRKRKRRKPAAVQLSFLFMDGFAAREVGGTDHKGEDDAEQEQAAKAADAGGGPQQGLRGKGRRPRQRGEGIRRGRQAKGKSEKQEEVIDGAHP